MSGKRKTLGVLIDHADYVSGGYESELRAGFEASCRRLDLNLLLFLGRALETPGYAAQNDIYRLVNRQSVDGIVVVAPGLATYTGIAGVTRLCQRLAHLPMCSLGLEIPGVPSIVLDTRPGLTQLIDHLVTVHRVQRPVFLAGPPNNPDACLRAQLVEESLGRHGLTLDAKHLETGLFTLPSGSAAMAAVCERGLDFDAVIAANDSMALGALEVLKSHGLYVPRDVALVGFDDIELAQLSSPPLSTVRAPLERIATRAVELVLAQLAGETVPARYDAPVEMVTRRSCGCSPHAQRRPPAVLGVRPRVEDFLHDRSEQMVQRMSDRLRRTGTAARDVALRLFAAMGEELGGCPEAFVNGVEEVIEQHGDQRELYDGLYDVLALLRSDLSHTNASLDDVWHEASALIALANTRASARQRIGVDLQYWHLLRSGERLLTAFDLPSLKRILAEEIPAMRLRNVVLSLYADSECTLLEPFLCLRDGAPLELAAEPYDAMRLVPAGTHCDDHRHTSFVWPLAADAERFGVALLEVGSGIGVHEMLREQISAALKSAALHREMVAKTALHERSVQERLATAKRMSALNVLAGGVAHDLNNALGPLVALPDVIRRELDQLLAQPHGDPSQLHADIANIKSAALRASQTIKDLLTSTRQGRTSKELLELNQVVASLLESDGHSLVPAGARIELRLELGATPLPVLASETHVQRALSNLLRNAAEASGGSGTITVTTRSLTLSEPWLGYEVIEVGKYALLSVSDTGRGIPAAELPRVFEPFFSKKRMGESSGSGLGLAIVHGVVKEHGGFLDVESRPEHGTTFRLYFPLLEGPERPVAQPSSRPPVAAASSARILVVDDDWIQLRTARRVLEWQGHRVQVSSSGRDALRDFEERARSGDASPYDLVLLDMLLNENEDGLALYERLTALYPDQRCVIVSGHAPNERGALAVQRGLLWLAKPYTQEALARAVARALTAPAAQAS